MQNETQSPPVRIKDFEIGPDCPLALIAGPCVIESHEHTTQIAEALRDITCDVGMPFVFKASYDKANRSSLDSYRGPGLEAGESILSDIHMSLDLPVCSDIHEPDHAEHVGHVLDVIQIPAFLCRQTDLLTTAARTGRVVNIKKGQFMSPEEMEHAVNKVRESGNPNVLLTERGTFFGYNSLVNDMTAIPRMARYAPVVFDATHSCQLPGAGRGQSGGRRAMLPTLIRAAIAAGAHALFLEVHDKPDQAKSDPATVWPLDKLKDLLKDCLKLADAR
jgi:2-dehydro-3-deoxyphosphooctonate aldolase (KDO 8-P synthase)